MARALQALEMEQKVITLFIDIPVLHC